MAKMGSDGYVVKTDGWWCRHKHTFLHRYIDMFTTSMKDKWAGLGYVDLFCGPGKSVIHNTNPVKEEDGSPLIAILAPHEQKQFDSLLFSDKNEEYLEALKMRVQQQNMLHATKLFCGDSNETVQRIVRAMDPNFLHLAFLDPYGLGLHFDTIRTLTSNRKVDLIISFFDRTDLIRNVRLDYNNPRSQRLDRYFGFDWRKLYGQLPRDDAVTVTNAFLEAYFQQLESIGYKHRGKLKRVSRDGGYPLYLMLYVSKHKLGVKFWNTSIAKDATGQPSLFPSNEE